MTEKTSSEKVEIKPNEFRCASCNEVFEKGWTDEEAKAELGENFPNIDIGECDMVCDDCYNQIMGVFKKPNDN